MSTVIEIKEVEFYPYKAVALLYSTNKNLWRVMGIKQKGYNVVLFESEEEAHADKFFKEILKKDKK